ncbi:hypothetical protein [Burkholderia multivorans]|uniref:hypothetical protein n=1 Tax=Burkholderia multivorans TaxID=87883 RepID=UPI00159249B3|nr:hypothetical protein [Burkholderia multivorans]
MKKMRKIAAVCVTVALLCGCAMNQRQQAYNSKMQAMGIWLNAQKDEVTGGRKTRSQVFSEYYDKAMATPSGPLDIPIMKYASHMVKAARAFESGQITREQYDDENRDEMTALNQSIQQIERQAAIDDQNRRQAAAAMYLQMRPRTTNCSGIGMYATCTTY